MEYMIPLTTLTKSAQSQILSVKKKLEDLTVIHLFFKHLNIKTSTLSNTIIYFLLIKSSDPIEVWS